MGKLKTGPNVTAFILQHLDLVSSNLTARVQIAMTTADAGQTSFQTTWKVPQRACMMSVGVVVL